MWKSVIIIVPFLALIMYSCSDRECIVDQKEIGDGSGDPHI